MMRSGEEREREIPQTRESPEDLEEVNDVGKVGLYARPVTCKSVRDKRPVGVTSQCLRTASIYSWGTYKE